MNYHLAFLSALIVLYGCFAGDPANAADLAAAENVAGPLKAMPRSAVRSFSEDPLLSGWVELEAPEGQLKSQSVQVRKIFGALRPEAVAPRQIYYLPKWMITMAVGTQLSRAPGYFTDETRLPASKAFQVSLFRKFGEIFRTSISAERFTVAGALQTAETYGYSGFGVSGRVHWRVHQFDSSPIELNVGAGFYLVDVESLYLSARGNLGAGLDLGLQSSFRIWGNLGMIFNTGYRFVRLPSVPKEYALDSDSETVNVPLQLSGPVFQASISYSL